MGLPAPESLGYPVLERQGAPMCHLDGVDGSHVRSRGCLLCRVRSYASIFWRDHSLGCFRRRVYFNGKFMGRGAEGMERAGRESNVLWRSVTFTGNSHLERGAIPVSAGSRGIDDEPDL